jgi:hypothetical protein
MNWRKQHIGLILMALLAFPILFQFVHVFRAHGFGAETTACHKSCCTTLPSPESDFGIRQEVNHCPVCEYEFACFNIVRKQEIAQINFYCKEKRVLPISGKLGNNVPICKKLRAPPAFL